MDRIRGDGPTPTGLTPADPFFAPLAGCLTFLSSLQVLTVVTSVAGIALHQPWALAILILAMLGGAIAWRKSIAFRRVEPVDPGPRSWSFVSGVIVAMGAGLFGALAFAAFISPDLSWDGNLYHLPTIQFWAQEGAIHWVDPRFQFSELANDYPKGAELVAFVLMRALGDGRWTNALNVAFLPLAVLGIASLACRLGAAPSLALSAGAAFVFVPVNIYQSTSTYVDTAYGCCVIGFLAALLRVQGRLDGEKGSTWSAALSLSAALGLCLGVRGTGWIPAATVPVVLLYAGINARRQGRGRMRLGSLSLLLLFIFGGALLVGGYWYARNFRHTGNPLHPLEVRLGHFQIFPGRPLDEIIYLKGNRDPGDVERGPVEMVLLNWLQGGGRWPRSIRGVDSRQGGIGFLWILGCLPALLAVTVLFAFRPGWRSRLRPAMILLVVGTGIFLATPMNWWARYTVWIYGIGLPILARALLELSKDSRRSRLAGAWIGLVLIIASTEAGLAAQEVLGRAYPGPRPVRIQDLLRPDNWRWPENYLLKSTRGTLIDDVIGCHDAVAVGPITSLDRNGLRQALIYGQLSNPPGGRRIVPVADPLTAEDRKALRNRRVRCLLWDGQRTPPPLEGINGERAVRAAGFWVILLRDSGTDACPGSNSP